MSEATNKPAVQANSTIQRVSASERFTAMVMKEFCGSVGVPQITDYQRQLIQGYFVVIDRALKTADEERLRKNKSNRDHKYDNDLPITWENVNRNDLALDVVHYARMGLDMMQSNHLFPIPYKNNKTSKYDVTLMPGYNGIRYVAEKYALTPPSAVTVELVYDSDTFKPIKKDRNNKVEGYEFSINNPFDRGKVVGGFGYLSYENPEKNELVIMTMHDIEKRKPQYASANFWGGTASEWQNGKKQEIEKEGWFKEMCIKTIKREVYSAKHIPRDPRKIDDDYQYMKARETRMGELSVDNEVEEKSGRTYIDVQASPKNETLPQADERPFVKVDMETGEVKEPVQAKNADPAPASEQPQEAKKPAPAPKQETGQQTFDVGF